MRADVRGCVHVVEVRNAHCRAIAWRPGRELVHPAHAHAVAAGKAGSRYLGAVRFGSGVGVGRAVVEVVVNVVSEAVRILLHRIPVRLPHVVDVVTRHAIGQRIDADAVQAAAGAKGERAARIGSLKRGVVEHVAAPIADRGIGPRLEERPTVVLIRRDGIAHAAPVVDVAENVERSDRVDRAGDAGARLADVVAPDAHVAVTALDLQAIVHHPLHDVAVHIGVVIREAGRGVVVRAADSVVVVMPGVGARHLVVADDVVAAAVIEGDALWSGRVRGVPAVRAVARIVDLVALYNDALHRGYALAAHAGVIVHAVVPTTGGAKTTPAADVVALDDDVVRAVQQIDGVGLGALQGEATHDDIRRRDRDVVGVLVLHVDRRAARIRLIRHVAARGAALRNGKRRRAGARRERDGLRDRELLAPGGRDKTGARGLPRHAELDLVSRARLEQHQAAAAFAVARVVPHVEALSPARVPHLAEDHGAAGARVRRRRPIEADRLEGR